VNELLKIDYSAFNNITVATIEDPKNKKNKNKNKNKNENQLVKTQDNICFKFMTQSSEFCNTNCEWEYEDYLVFENLLSSSNSFKYHSLPIYIQLLLLSIIGILFI